MGSASQRGSLQDSGGEPTLQQLPTGPFPSHTEAALGWAALSRRSSAAPVARPEPSQQPENTSARSADNLCARDVPPPWATAPTDTHRPPRSLSPQRQPPPPPPPPLAAPPPPPPPKPIGPRAPRDGQEGGRAEEAVVARRAGARSLAGSRARRERRRRGRKCAAGARGRRHPNESAGGGGGGGG